ncbi:MAG: hypothetical protein JXR96_11295 [Deltaproteobacteria bacterium]|nr:hypothetical protein [Deltaproteobacteria bacterium]
MSAIVLLDTSIYLNILDVPGSNQDRSEVLDEFKARIERGDNFLLPLATILETGNHIADLQDGNHRFAFAERLLLDVKKAMEGQAPYRPTRFPDREVFMGWLKDFPEYVKRSGREQREGISLSDLSIIKEWEATRSMNNMRRTQIWSLDSHLAGYDFVPS